jgi:putative aldouronate transport system substrate-binding protein
MNKCNDIMKQGIPKAVLAKPEEFETIWAGLMEELKKAGVEKMNAEFTKLLKARVELWNN